MRPTKGWSQLIPDCVLSFFTKGKNNAVQKEKKTISTMLVEGDSDVAQVTLIHMENVSVKSTSSDRKFLMICQDLDI